MRPEVCLYFTFRILRFFGKWYIYIHTSKNKFNNSAKDNGSIRKCVMNVSQTVNRIGVTYIARA